MILRDESGAILLSSSRYIPRCTSALEAELAACREGIAMAREWSDQPCIVEMDSAQAVSMVKASEMDRSCLLHEVHEIKRLLMLVTKLDGLEADMEFESAAVPSYLQPDEEPDLNLSYISSSKRAPGEDEGNTTRMRIAYSREFLISVGTSSEACRRRPVGFDASKLSELGLVDAGSRERYVAPFGRWGNASSSGSGNTESMSNQLDRHPGNQCRDNWQSKEHDGLLGSGTFPRIPCYAGPLASNDQGSRYQLTRNAGGYQPTRQYKAPPVSHQNVDLINTVTFGSFENWNKDRVEEERKKRALFELTRKEQHHALQEKKKAPDCDKENLGDGSLLQNSAGKRDPPTKSDKKGGLNISSLSKEDAIESAPLLPTPTISPLKPLGFTNGLPQKRLESQSFNTSHNSEDMPKLYLQSRWFLSATECANFDEQWLEIHLPEEDTLFSVSDFSYTQNTDHWSAAEGAKLDKEGLEIHLPDEDTLFSVNDFSYTQNTDHSSAAEWARAEGLLPKDKVVDINYRFQSLDVLGSQSHDQIDPNNLYHLFETTPYAESPKRNARNMFLQSRPSDGNQHAPFDMPKAIRHGAYCPCPQDMKSMQYVLPPPAGLCAGPAVPQHILPQMTMPGSSLPPQGFQTCVPLPQPVHHMPHYRTEMMGANSFQMHHCQPGYGEHGMMVTVTVPYSSMFATNAKNGIFVT
ncbi:hypothetical protein ACQ4PT_041152 [Festuca glaucescens]